VLAFATWGVVSAWQMVAAAGAATVAALWLLPGLIALHLFQLLISSQGWRVLFAEPPADWVAFHRLRVIREGIDSLLPVAQVGGEVIGAQLLARYGIPLALAAASVVVDVTLEFVSHLVFLLIGLVAWAILAPGGGRAVWLAVAAVAAAMVCGLLAAQRFGLLRLIEAMSRRIAARAPGLLAVSLDGLDDAAARLYARHGATFASAVLHLAAWTLGTLETWVVLKAVGQEVALPVALVVESLGMAARSAGFAIPGALVVQEAGFVLSAAAMGLPESAGLALSLVKRVREVGTGLIGLALWHHSRRVQA
jgi:putative membrane protein